MRFRPFLIACLMTLPAFAADLLWGPYLQDVRGDRAAILWTTTGDAAPGSIRYFRPDGAVDTPSSILHLPVSQTGLAQDIWLHRALLTNLDSRTEYRYQLHLGARLTSDDPAQRFVTAGELPFRFLVIGDTGDNGSGQRLLAQPLNRESAAFLLHTGDIAYWDGTYTQFQAAYFNIYGELLKHMPVFPTLGNHDALSEALPYRTLFTPPQENVPSATQRRYYSFDWANAHFTVIDSNQSFSPGSPMYEWIEQDLRRTGQTWRIVSIHHPPFPSTDYKRNDPVCKLVSERLTPLFERYAVHLVLSGHEHIYQRTQPRRAGRWTPDGPGTVYVTSGGGGSQLYEPGKDAFLSAGHGGGHYLRITAGPATLLGEAVDADGRIVDQWELSPSPILLPDGIRNAASFDTAIAPGGLVSLFGWNFDDATVMGNAGEWPILYADRTQINAQIPFASSSRDNVIVTTRHGRTSAQVTLATAAPAIFVVTVAGQPRAAAIHANGQLVDSSHPALPQEWISLYATGLGTVRGTFRTGIPAPMAPLYETDAPVQVRLNALPVEASAAVLAPGYVGLYQINFRVPPGLPSGPLSLQLLAAGRAGNIVLLDVR